MDTHCTFVNPRPKQQQQQRHQLQQHQQRQQQQNHTQQPITNNQQPTTNNQQPTTGGLSASTADGGPVGGSAHDHLLFYEYHFTEALSTTPRNPRSSSGSPKTSTTMTSPSARRSLMRAEDEPITLKNACRLVNYSKYDSQK